jgi:integrase
MPTLGAALATYLKLDRSPVTNRQYGYVLNRLIADIGPARDVQRVAYEDLVDQLATLNIAVSTRRGYIAIYKAFFSWCDEVGYLAVSPAARLKRPRRDRAVAPPRAIPPDELRAIVEYVRVDSPRNYAIILFLADTGCRVGGLLSLTLDNLHVEDGYAWVYEKGGKWHCALFGPDTAAALRQWLARRPSVKHRFVWTGKSPGYEPLSRQAVHYVIRTVSQRVGCTREWFPHAVRHAVGYAWADAGIAPTIVAAKLGHNDPKITMDHYYPRDMDRLRTTSQRLALQALKPSSHERFSPVPLPETAPPKKRAVSE